MGEAKKISQFHYITEGIIKFQHWELAEQACKAGVNWIQLRVKDQTDATWKRCALETLEVCNEFGAKLIINDNVNLAKEVGADGVHLGKHDLPVKYAREILGKDCIIGGTANTFDEVKMLANEGVDYVGLGPFKFTPTKKMLSPILGLEGYKNILKRCQLEGIKIPVIAIGGIKAEDVKGLQKFGVHGIAVSSDLTFGNDKAGIVAQYNWELDTVKNL